MSRLWILRCRWIVTQWQKTGKFCIVFSHHKNYHILIAKNHTHTHSQPHEIFIECDSNDNVTHSIHHKSTGMKESACLVRYSLGYRKLINKINVRCLDKFGIRVQCVCTFAFCLMTLKSKTKMRERKEEVAKTAKTQSYAIGIVNHNHIWTWRYKWWLDLDRIPKSKECIENT